MEIVAEGGDSADFSKCSTKWPFGIWEEEEEEEEHCRRNTNDDEEAVKLRRMEAWSRNFLNIFTPPDYCVKILSSFC